MRIVSLSNYFIFKLLYTKHFFYVIISYIHNSLQGKA